MNKDNIYIIIPAYNEAENIVQVVNEWLGVVNNIGNESKLVIINDGSKDNTLELLINLKETSEIYKNLIILDKNNSGHGPTVLFGYKYAIKNKPSYIFQTDSDGQTCSSEFYSFWKNRHNSDVIIGNRKSREDGFSRIIVTKTLKLVLFLVFHEKITDANTPFRLMNTETLKKVINLIPEDFFLSNVLLSVLFVKAEDIKVEFKEITFKPRQGGVNSINLKRIIKIGIKAIKDFSIIKKRLHI